MVSKTICPLPFSHQHVQPNGEVLFCCAARRNSNLDDQGNQYNVNTHTLKEAWNGPSLQKVRLELIAGETPETCQYCWERENSDHSKGSSMRMDFLERIPIDTISDRIEEAKQNNGVISKNPFDFQIMSGNLCNLSCKMCTPQYSTSFSKFYTNKGINDFDEIIFSKNYIPNQLEKQHFNQTYDWPNTNPLNKILEPYYQDIKSIFLIGGEPTIIDGTFKFLQKMIYLGYSKSIYPFISTNCTNINKELLNLLDEFDSTGINLSLDGMDEIAYIQRTPSNWKRIQQNVDQIMEWNLLRTKKYTNITIHSVITSLNIHHIPIFWRYMIDKYSKYNFSISFMPIIEDTDNFSIKIIPKNVADKIINYSYAISQSLTSNRHRDTFEKLIYTLESLNYSESYDNIHYQLEQIQKLHPDIDIKKIYSIYYQDSL